MKKFRFLLVLCLVVICAGAIAACGGIKSIQITLGDEAVTSVTISLNRGATLRVRVTPDAAADDVEAEWTSSDTSTVVVEPLEGVLGADVSGLKYGEATVTVRIGKKTASCVIKVEPVPLASISLNHYEKILVIKDATTPAAIDLSGFNSLQLEADTQPVFADNPSVSWQSDNPAVAEVDADTGLVTAKAVGTATISVISDDNPELKEEAVIKVVTPTAISTNAELRALKPENPSQSIDGYFYLTQDIVAFDDIDEPLDDWISLGDLNGVLNGMGRTITVKRDERPDISTEPADEPDPDAPLTTNVGLFRTIMPEGIVMNLAVTGGTIDRPVIYNSWAGAIAQDNEGIIRNCFLNIVMSTAYDYEGYLGGVVCNNHKTPNNAPPNAPTTGIIENTVVVSIINGLGMRGQEEWGASFPPNGGIAIGANPEVSGVLGEIKSSFYDNERANTFVSQALFDEAPDAMGWDDPEIFKYDIRFIQNRAIEFSASGRTVKIDTLVLASQGQTHLSELEKLFAADPSQEEYVLLQGSDITIYSYDAEGDSFYDIETISVDGKVVVYDSTEMEVTIKRVFVTGAVGMTAYADSPETPAQAAMRKTTSQMQTASTFADFNADIWLIEDGSYPSLKLISLDL
ncbi:MAG: Ig-like domain-containing protein [Firmicutes bacterium]|nr:Ig-like domain-containing protein [Bacillota bacterium]